MPDGQRIKDAEIKYARAPERQSARMPERQRVRDLPREFEGLCSIDSLCQSDPKEEEPIGRVPEIQCPSVEECQRP